MHFDPLNHFAMRRLCITEVLHTQSETRSWGLLWSWTVAGEVCFDEKIAAKMDGVSQGATSATGDWIFWMGLEIEWRAKSVAPTSSPDPFVVAGRRWADQVNR